MNGTIRRPTTRGTMLRGTGLGPLLGLPFGMLLILCLAWAEAHAAAPAASFPKETPVEVVPSGRIDFGTGRILAVLFGMLVPGLALGAAVARVARASRAANRFDALADPERPLQEGPSAISGLVWSETDESVFVSRRLQDRPGMDTRARRFWIASHTGDTIAVDPSAEAVEFWGSEGGTVFGQPRDAWLNPSEPVHAFGVLRKERVPEAHGGTLRSAGETFVLREDDDHPLVFSRKPLRTPLRRREAWRILALGIALLGTLMVNAFFAEFWLLTVSGKVVKADIEVVKAFDSGYSEEFRATGMATFEGRRIHLSDETTGDLWNARRACDSEPCKWVWARFVVSEWFPEVHQIGGEPRLDVNHWFCFWFLAATIGAAYAALMSAEPRPAVPSPHGSLLRTDEPASRFRDARAPG